MDRYLLASTDLSGDRAPSSWRGSSGRVTSSDDELSHWPLHRGSMAGGVGEIVTNLVRSFV
jgi:hypothetical protein